LIDNRRRPRRISLAANAFWSRNRFHCAGRGWFRKTAQVAATLSGRNPILTSKAVTKAMQTFLSFLAISDPSPRVLMIIGALSLGLLAVFLRHKLG
jgi:hypothetical protein